jgi:hypothetical protein
MLHDDFVEGPNMLLSSPEESQQRIPTSVVRLPPIDPHTEGPRGGAELRNVEDGALPSAVYCVPHFDVAPCPRRFTASSQYARTHVRLHANTHAHARARTGCRGFGRRSTAVKDTTARLAQKAQEAHQQVRLSAARCSGAERPRAVLRPFSWAKLADGRLGPAQVRHADASLAPPLLPHRGAPLR